MNQVGAFVMQFDWIMLRDPQTKRWHLTAGQFSLALTWLFMGRFRWNKFHSIAETRFYQKSFRFKVMRVTVQPQIKSKLRTKSKDGDTRGHVTWNCRPNVSSDRVAPKTKSVEHIKAFRFMSIWFASSSKLSTFFFKFELIKMARLIKKSHHIRPWIFFFSGTTHRNVDCEATKCWTVWPVFFYFCADKSGKPVDRRPIFRKYFPFISIGRRFKREINDSRIRFRHE